MADFIQQYYQLIKHCSSGKRERVNININIIIIFLF